MTSTRSGERVVIRFEQDEETAAKHQIHSVAAERKCRDYIASHRPGAFGFKFDGWFPAPAVEVAISGSLLQQLPLLKDVQSSTPVGETIPAPSTLPCTI